jgi:hypothetical protein
MFMLFSIHQEILDVYGAPKVHYCVHRSAPPDPILILLNTVQTSFLQYQF